VQGTFFKRLSFVEDKKFPLEYKGIRLEAGYRPDIVVADLVVVECKTVTTFAPVHEAQLLSYLKLGGWKIGLLINFNVVLLKDGIRRRILGFD
jgi:GxxExxY protein